MEKPDWIKKYKEPKTEIKWSNGHFYKYRVEYKYNKEKKRTDKITREILGKVTEEGFFPSEKTGLKEVGAIDIKQYGAFKMFFDLLEEDIESLLALFDEKTSKLLLISAFMRWAHQAPIKRMPELYQQNYISEIWPLEQISAQSISAALKKVGGQRAKVVEWMRQKVEFSSSAQEFVMIDGTHISSASEQLNINCKGYNSSQSYDPQVNLIYIYSISMKQPVYYRMVNGNIIDLKSMKNCIDEIGLDKVCFVADKGFYSRENIELLQGHELQYIVPLKRNNGMIDFSLLAEEGFKHKLQYFIYYQRVIWYCQYESDGQTITTYLDEQLKVQEERDYLSRIVTHPESYTLDKFRTKINKFGTLSLISNFTEKTDAGQLYEVYKQRNEIEVLFAAYKGFLEADRTYMQDRLVMEGWLMANFIAMKVYYRLLQKLKNQDLVKKYSPMDLLEYAKGVSALKIKNEWRVSETTKKTQQLFAEIGIDYLKLKS